MLLKQDVGLNLLKFIKECTLRLLLLLCFCFICHSHNIYGNDYSNQGIYKSLEASRDKKIKQSQVNTQTLTYYLSVVEFAESFITIPTTSINGGSTLSSKYLAGRAAIYNTDNEKVGTCSASFLCMQNQDGIYTDISNYISVDNGLVVSWFTPTTLINLETDSIIHSMVTECMVTASTKIGFNPFYGQTFNLIVSSENGRIYFEFTRTGTIF